MDVHIEMPSRPRLERAAARLCEAAAAVESAIEETRACAARSRVDVAVAAQGVITTLDPRAISRSADSLLSAIALLETAKIAALESDGVAIDEALEAVQRYIDMEVCSPEEGWRVCSFVDAHRFGPSEQPTLLFVADDSEPPSATLGRIIHYPRPTSALLGEVASSLWGTSEVINTTIAEIHNNAITCRDAVRDAAVRAAASFNSESDGGGFIALSSAELLAKIDSIESRKVAALTEQDAVVREATEILRRASTCWGSLTGEEAARVVSLSEVPAEGPTERPTLIFIAHRSPNPETGVGTVWAADARDLGGRFDYVTAIDVSTSSGVASRIVRLPIIDVTRGYRAVP